MYLNEVQKPYTLCNLPFAKKINDIIYSKWFVFLIAFLTLATNVFGLELYFFTFMALTAIYISFFGKDYLPYFPMLVFCYVSASKENNPGYNENSIFFMQNGGGYIIILAVLIVVSIIIRFMLDPETGFSNFNKINGKVMLSFAVLGVAFALSGFNNAQANKNALNNAIISLIQFCAFFLPYFVLSLSIRWDTVEKDYFAFVCLLLGVTIGLEVVFIYMINNVDLLKPYKPLITTGWGVSNNLAVMLTMSIPFAFYFILIKKHIVPAITSFIFISIAIVLTMSRNSILILGLVVVVCQIVLFLKTKDTFIRFASLSSLAIIALSICGLYFFSKFFENIFFFGLSSPERVEIYTAGIKIFLDYPLFGGSFYSLNIYSELANWESYNIEAFTSFFPGRWHNTIIQMLACCGTVGIVAYAIHRFYTIKVFLTSKGDEHLFIFISVMVLLASSMLDSHLFNLGPTLLYSCAIAFAEFKKKHYILDTPFNEIDLNSIEKDYLNTLN